MYAAIDGLSDKLDKQVRRYKDRVRGNHANAAKRAATAG
jgi:ribosome-associated translation inhibitor RaiA